MGKNKVPWELGQQNGDCIALQMSETPIGVGESLDHGKI